MFLSIWTWHRLGMSRFWHVQPPFRMDSANLHDQVCDFSLLQSFESFETDASARAMMTIVIFKIRKRKGDKETGAVMNKAFYLTESLGLELIQFGGIHSVERGGPTTKIDKRRKLALIANYRSAPLLPKTRVNRISRINYGAYYHISMGGTKRWFWIDAFRDAWHLKWKEDLSGKVLHSSVENNLQLRDRKKMVEISLICSYIDDLTDDTSISHSFTQFKSNEA